MNAGEINIAVTATMTDFNRTMGAVKASAMSSGDAAGKGFASGFKSQIADISTNFSNQMMGNVRKAFGAGAFVSGLSTALQSAAKGADIGTVFTDSVKALPFIGGLASAIEAAMASAIGTLDAEAGLEEARRKEADSERKLAEAERKADVSNQRIADRKRAIEESQARRGIQMALDAGDQRAAAEAEAMLEQMKLQERVNGMMRDENYKWERQSIYDLFVEENKNIKETLERKYKDIAEKEKKVADDAAKKASEDAKKLAEQKRREAEELQKDLADKEASLLSERIAAQQAGLGSASTALGSFKFDAYPSIEKRKNDDRIVGTLEAIRDQQRTAGFI
jgi:hypothetical protein